MVQTVSFPHGFVLQTKDLDEASSLLNGTAIPYVAELAPSSPPFSTQIFITAGQRTYLSRVITTGEMRVKASLPGDSFALVLDLRAGVGEHRVGGKSFAVDSECAFLQSPLQVVEVLTPPDFDALFVRFQRDALVGQLEKMLDREIQTEMVFSPGVSLQSAAGRRLRELAGSLRRILYSTEQHSVPDSLPLREIEDELITLLLQSQTHNYTRLLHRRSDASLWQIDSAEQYMRANAHLPLSLADVCQAAGVNARTLQHSFRKKRGCTPMQFLRNLRMEEVRSGLLRPTDATSVTSEAARWGFLHFGRFSHEYRAIYGELPSETLRRSKKIL